MMDRDNVNTYILTVLDHGHVRLIETMGSDLSIVRNARISYDAAWRAGENEGSDAKLINYLMRNAHTTPFESVVFTFDIKAPIFVVRQWHRHRTWSYNELSARYKELPAEFYLPDIEQITTQSKDNKQMRTEEQNENAEFLRNSMHMANETNFAIYKHYLALGCPRELARTVLPLATYTHFFGTVDLHNLLHFLKLRLHPHAQWEIRQYAKAICKLIQPSIPVTYAAWVNTLEQEIFDELPDIVE